MKDPNKIASGGKLVIPGMKSAAEKPAAASKPFTNRPIPGSAAQPVPSEMKPSSAQTSSAPSAASVKQQFGTSAELKRDTEKAAAKIGRAHV